MKKYFVMALLIIAAVGAGFASNRLRNRKQAIGYTGVPHSILYRIEYFDESGKSTGVGTQARHVKADGTWRNVTILPDGSFHPSSGKMNRRVTTAVDDGTFPEHLGYKCFIAKDPLFDLWLNSELQDEVRSEKRYSNGQPEMKKYALDIAKE